MIENPTTIETFNAMHRAHEARAEAMRNAWAWLFRR